MTATDPAASATLVDVKRDEVISIRLDEAELEAWQAAATADQRKLSDWIRLTVNAALRDKLGVTPKKKARR